MNAHEVRYFEAFGLECVHDVALGLKPPSDGYVAQLLIWREVTLANAREHADGYS